MSYGGIHCQDLGENWPCCDGTALHWAWRLSENEPKQLTSLMSGSITEQWVSYMLFLATAFVVLTHSSLIHSMVSRWTYEWISWGSVWKQVPSMYCLYTLHIGLLTLNILSCFPDNKICNHILNPYMDLVWHKLIKFTLEQQYTLPILQSQYCACWCPGDFRSQGINRHGIDPIRLAIPSSASEELTGIL